MDRREYHGSFQHPVRAFVIGCGLLMLLLAGWIVGVEAGGTSIATRTHIRVVTNRTRIVRLPGIGRSRVIVVRSEGRDVIAYLPLTESGQLDGATTSVLPLTLWVH